jgi:hypothetical protein
MVTGVAMVETVGLAPVWVGVAMTLSVVGSSRLIASPESSQQISARRVVVKPGPEQRFLQQQSSQCG